MFFNILNIGIVLLISGLALALKHSLSAESELKKKLLKLSKYQSLEDIEGYKQQLNSNIRQLENHQQSLENKIINLKQQFDEFDAKVYLQSIDYYEPKYEFITSEDYILRLKDIKQQQNRMQTNNQAYICDGKWTVGDSEIKGDKMINDVLKLVEISFEERCNYAVKEVKYNNVDSLKIKINKAFEKYNKYLKTLQCKIAEEYLQLKLIELDLQYELEDKKKQEQEKDREINKQKKERAAIDKERQRVEEAVEEAEERERRHQEELDKIRQEIIKAKEEEQKQLEIKIQDLERLVAEDRSEKENALSESKKLKSGYIYIVSNIGSFGQDMYRICMTSRSQENVYIREMNPAVPFQFDVNFKIFSEDAWDTLQRLHKCFDDKRVNLVNPNRQFFKVSINEIEAAVKEVQKKSGVFLRIDECEKSSKAYEYRQTLVARKKNRLTNTNEEYSKLNEIA
jgi:hypothetical protein